MTDLDAIDRAILDELQRDASQNQSDLAETVGMSRTSCWRRIRDFEEAGLIERRPSGDHQAYAMTASGDRLYPILKSLGAWVESHEAR